MRSSLIITSLFLLPLSTFAIPIPTIPESNLLSYEKRGIGWKPSTWSGKASEESKITAPNPQTATDLIFPPLKPGYEFPSLHEGAYGPVYGTGVKFDEKGVPLPQPIKGYKPPEGENPYVEPLAFEKRGITMNPSTWFGKSSKDVEAAVPDPVTGKVPITANTYVFPPLKPGYEYPPLGDAVMKFDNMGRPEPRPIKGYKPPTTPDRRSTPPAILSRDMDGNSFSNEKRGWNPLASSKKPSARPAPPPGYYYPPPDFAGPLDTQGRQLPIPIRNNGQNRPIAPAVVENSASAPNSAPPSPGRTIDKRGGPWGKFGKGSNKSASDKASPPDGKKAAPKVEPNYVWAKSSENTFKPVGPLGSN